MCAILLFLREHRSLRSSHQIGSKFTGEHPYWKVISIKLQSNCCIFSEQLFLRKPLEGCFCKRVFTREISSWDETRPGMKSSLSMVKCLLLFTRFCRDEISSRDERQGWDFIPDEKKKKRRVNTSSRDKILRWACF